MGKKTDMALRIGLGAIPSAVVNSPHVKSAARALGRAVRETAKDPSGMVKAHPAGLAGVAAKKVAKSVPTGLAGVAAKKVAKSVPKKGK